MAFSSHVLILPGWHHSGPIPWQSRWQALYGYTRVEQHDWVRPLRGDWSMRLEESLLRLQSPAVLVAHGLACQLVSAWAAHSQQSARVMAALLVAPLDPEQEELQSRLPSWSPPVLKRLPFKSTVVAPHSDPHCRWERAKHFSQSWGSQWHELNPAGPLDTDSALADWHQGHALLQALIKN